MGGGANPFMQKYVKSITAVNDSILALSEAHQPAAAPSCIRRATVLTPASSTNHDWTV